MSYHVLLVDDDPDFREELRESLLERFRVSEASSGEEALKILNMPHAIDVVIMDVVMPGLSGTDALKAIKAIAPHLSVIILTGKSSKDIAVQALKGRADDYIEKPFPVDHLFKTVDRVLAGREEPALDGLKNRNKIERVKRFIERNSVQKVNLKDAAQEVCLSLKYLSRTFKEKTGTGFNEYRLTVKMQRAQELLKEPGVSVCDVALRLGYKNPESFIRMFKKRMGQTPKEFRMKAGAPKQKHDKRKSA
jgi:two-component system, response regulator YesN